MPNSTGRKGTWFLLGLGGLAAACGALAYHRRRTRPQGNAGGTPAVPWFPSSAASGPVPLDWNPEQAPDGTASAFPRPMDADEEVPSSPAGPEEPWLEPLRRAMEGSPHAYGYGKSAWTAPLLSRYLQDTRGLETPLPAVRKALKDLGYRWEHTRYVQAGGGASQDGFTSEGMG